MGMLYRYSKRGVCEKVHQTFVFLRYSEVFFTADIVTILQDIYADLKHKTSPRDMIIMIINLF